MTKSSLASGKISKLHLVNMLLLLWKCLRPPLIGGELIGSQRSLDQKEQKKLKFGDLTLANSQVCFVETHLNLSLIFDNLYAYDFPAISTLAISRQSGGNNRISPNIFA